MRVNYYLTFLSQIIIFRFCNMMKRDVDVVEIIYTEQAYNHLTCLRWTLGLSRE